MQTHKLMLTTALAASLLALASTAQAGFVVQMMDIFGIDFPINNPGARANGMGGAFIGLADDATAAFTNPAGLTVLTKPEVSLEYKYGKYTNLIYNPVDIGGGNLGKTDVEYQETLSGPSFISYVHPTDKASFSIYRHQMMNQKTSFDFMTEWPEKKLHTDLEVEANTLGFALGVKTFQTLSFGLSAGFTDMQYMEHATQPTRYEEVDGRDQAIHYTASLLWQPSEQLGVGLVYRQGPEFSFRKKGYTNTQILSDYNNDGLINFSDYDTNGDGVFDATDFPQYDSVRSEEYNFQHDVKMPDVYGLGLSYRIIPSLTITTDVNYIEYSDLDIVGGTDSDLMDGYAIDDTYEAHVGLEYVVELGENPLALRCGYFYKPGHRLHVTRFEGDLLQMSGAFPEGDTQHIYSLGIGTLISDNVQLDLAGTFGDLITEGTASLVYRFE